MRTFLNLWVMSAVMFTSLFISSQSSLAANTKTILVLGDSLSAGYGIDLDKSWPSLLNQNLVSQQSKYRVINESISGETTAGGVARINRLLKKHTPTITIIELGSNDGLRGLSLKQMKSNLQSMIDQAKAIDSKVLLIGNRMPPNFGPGYTKAFFNSFQTVANTNQIPLVPFFLEKVALNESLMQKDGLHPTAEAQPLLLETVMPKLQPLL